MHTVHETTLDNGLKVLLKEAHAAPVTSTWLWYRVGSRNEVEGSTGLSHWLEHMMFKGSPLYPKGEIMRLVDRQGGYLNAMTSLDFTAYYTTLPSDRAEVALAIESDRMVSALLDREEAKAERGVIVAEREGSENQPNYVLAEEVVAAAFRVHPYHHQTIGWKADLEMLRYEQLVAHYRQYYMPNNAVLVIVGDFEADAYIAVVERYFGGIPAGDSPERTIQQEPLQRGERRVAVRMPGSVPLLRLSYHAPAVSHRDYIPLVIADAVLSGGKAMFSFGDAQARSARIYRALVETQLASSAGSNYHPSLDPFLFTLGAAVREGGSPEAVEEAILAEIAKLRAEHITEEELAVAIRQAQAQFAYSSESVTNQGLTLGFVEMVDHYQRIDVILDELAQVTPDDVIRVARTYLYEDNRVVGWFIPTEEGGAPGEAETPSPAFIATNWTQPRRGMCALTGALSHRHKPPISPETVVRQRLDNGITVLIVENPSSASVTVEGSLGVGSFVESDDEVGLANLTASMIRRGTERHTFQELNRALDNVGASLSCSAGRDDTGFGGRALAADIDLLIDLLSEALMRATLPRHEFETLRGQLVTYLGMLETDTGYRSNRALAEMLYGEGHPYARPTMGTRESLAHLTVDNLAGFYHAHYAPKDLLLSVVGAIDSAHVLALLAETLGRWQPRGTTPERIIPPPHPPAGIAQRRIAIPGKSQVDMVLGVVGMSRTSKDYYAAVVTNLILGQIGLMGRLGDQVRDKLGLAYHVGSHVHAGRAPRAWNITASVNADNIEPALAAILIEVERIREEPVTDQELADSHSYLTGALPLHLETNSGIAGFLLTLEEYDLGLDYLERQPEIVRSITKADIQRVARAYLSLDHYVLAMAGTF